MKSTITTGNLSKLVLGAPKSHTYPLLKLPLGKIDVIKDTMTNFCSGSRHCIDIAKYKAFFLKNVNLHYTEEPSNMLGISITTDLGKYLNVPLLHERANNRTCHPILQKVLGKLST